MKLQKICVICVITYFLSTLWHKTRLIFASLALPFVMIFDFLFSTAIKDSPLFFPSFQKKSQKQDKHQKGSATNGRV